MTTTTQTIQTTFPAELRELRRLHARRDVSDYAFGCFEDAKTRLASAIDDRFEWAEGFALFELEDLVEEAAGL